MYGLCCAYFFTVEDEGIDDEKQLGDILKEMELYSAQCTDLENSILHGKGNKRVIPVVF